MDKEAAKKYIKGQLERYLQTKGINTSGPFRCITPDHHDNNPSMSIDRNSPSGPHCKCFSCGAYLDTFDLIGLDYGLTNKSDIFKKAYEIFNIDVDHYNNSFVVNHRFNSKYQNQPKNEQKAQLKIHNTDYINQYTIDNMQNNEVKIDFTDIVNEAHNKLFENPKALEYLIGRGLSIDIIKTYKLGYDINGYNHFLKAFPKNQSKSNKASLYRYIFPYPDLEGRYGYFITEIEDRSQIDEYNGKYRKISKGQSGIVTQIFNERYFYAPPSVIFVCEGIYDALSVEEVGGKAIAFAGTAYKRFLGLCNKYHPNTTFIIALDNDQAGQITISKLKEGLDFLNIPYIVSTVNQGKDCNEALQIDRKAFTEYIQQIMTKVEQEQKAKEEKKRQAYLNNSVAYQLQNFIDNIEKSKTEQFFPTGFSSLDCMLDGGLYAGLYIVGSISSLGKTTFCLQIADQLAQQGKDVIIFSLEMSKYELIAKSISRLTCLKDLEENGNKNCAKTTRGILTGTRYKDYDQKEKALIDLAMTDYSRFANRIYIYEGVGNIGVDQIREKVERHIDIMSGKPVIFIDYIQILAPYSERATDKQNTDKNVLELKRLSRDYSIPVIGISSFNRDNYMQPVNMASFKESGAVEYSSDVLIALQYEGMDYQPKEKDGDRQKRIRKLFDDQISIGRKGEAQSIQVKILKNRNGSKGDTVLDFYPMFNLFSEKDKYGITNKNLGVVDEKEGWTQLDIREGDIPF